MDHEPTNAKFYTDRLLLWKDATLNFYMDLHERGVHQHSPKWRTNSDGHQLVTHGNLSDDGDFHVTVFFYNKGIVLIQGTNFKTWDEEDVSVINSTGYCERDVS